ncbi:MAG: ABC transporter substrate-binding protein [Elusimicrobia bacterium]|nr:ABC transporter substrate-binding protein [Elusimicrobiota bacterium]
MLNRYLLAGVSALVLSSLARAEVKNPETFYLAEVGEVTSLDPSFPYDNSSQGLIFNVYDTLIGFEGDNLEKFVPALATEVPTVQNGLISKDGKSYRFPLRKGVKFHDGSMMTPEDARYSLLRFMLTDPPGGPASLLLEPILGVNSTRDSSGTSKVDFAQAEKAVRVEGDSVVITLPKPFAPFLSIMARWSYVLPKGWAAANGQWDGRAETWKQFNNLEKSRSFLHTHMNGSGPFKLERWDPVAKYVLLVRHDEHWRGPAALRRVAIKTVPEFTTRRLALQAGDLDLIETPRPLVSQLEGMPGVRIVDNLPRLATDPVLFFTFNINAFANRDIGSGRLDGEGIPPEFFSDPDVRKGFAYAFDYEALRKDTFKGTARRAKGPIPPGVFGYDEKQPFYEYDLKKAAEHLRRAWNGKLWERGFKFTLTYNVGSENREAACNILKKNIESLNPKFKIDMRGVEWGAYLDKAQRRQMPLFSRGWWADYPDGHNFVYAFYHSAGRYASAQGYRSVEMDMQIEKAVRETDLGKRRLFYQRILRHGFEEAPSIVTVHPRGVYAMREWVKGFQDNPVYLGIYFYPIKKAP